MNATIFFQDLVLAKNKKKAHKKNMKANIKSAI